MTPKELDPPTSLAKLPACCRDTDFLIFIFKKISCKRDTLVGPKLVASTGQQNLTSIDPTVLHIVNNYSSVRTVGVNEELTISISGIL